MDVTNDNAKRKFSAKVMDFFTVDIEMLPSKICYLLFGGLLGSHVPYLTVFFVSVGLSTSRAGFINGMRFASGSISGPLWGMYADTGRRKLVLILLCLGSAFPLFSMPWVSHAIYSIPLNSSCPLHVNISDVKKKILFHHSDPSTDGCLDTEEKMAANDTLFYVLLSIMMFCSVFVGPLPGYIDSIVLNVVKTAKKKSNYGVQRIFGSLGFSIASFVAGVAADHYKDPHMSQYTAVFCLYLPYTLLLIPFGCYLIGQIRWEEITDNTVTSQDDDARKKQDISMTSQLIYMFRKFDVIFFMSTVMVSGLACNVVQNFSILLVSDVMDASETEMSLIFVIATASEVLLFPFTGRLIKFLGGTSVAIIIGIFSYFVRFLVMSYTKHLWVMLLIQTLHALGFALTWAAMMEYLHEVTPSEIIFTMFLVFQSVHFGIAALIANIAGGYIYQSYGGRALFRGKAVVCGVWALVMVMYYGGKHAKGRYFLNITYEHIDDEKDLLSACDTQVVRYGCDKSGEEIINPQM